MRATHVSPRWYRLRRRASPPTLATGASYSAEGGIRAPAAGIPAPALSGLAQSGAALCFLLGAAAPFSAIQLAAQHSARAQPAREPTFGTLADAMAGLTCPADARDLF